MTAIRQKAVELQSLSLSPEEGFVLSRVDGRSTMKELVALTGLDEARVVAIVGRLQAAGALDVEEISTAPSAARPSAPPAVEAELLSFLQDADAPEAEESSERAHQDSEDTDDSAEPGDAPEHEDDDDAAELRGDDAAEAATNERAYRTIYETVYRPLGRDRRIDAALTVTGAHLSALCFDAEPQVVHALSQNPRAGLDHARLVALHHRTQVGLDAIAKRADWLADALVSRRLLRNPQLPTPLLGRIVSPKPTIEVYKIAIDREIPERTRVMTRELLRKKFMVSSSDERAALLFKTEGRCLALLVSCSLDAHATQILCSKQNYSSLFVQNLARWSATPPMLLVHLLRNPIVRRNLGLRKMLLRHPNTPSDAKRQA